jgi:hypothetical protein
MTPELPLKGSCGCGAVRFEVDKPLTGALYCHCTRCQKRTGSASGATGRVEIGSVRVVAGEEHLRDWWPEGGMGKTFCVLCGSGVLGRNREGEIFGVRLGAIDGDPGMRPTFRQWLSSAATWEDVPDDGLDRYMERAG